MENAAMLFLYGMIFQRFLIALGGLLCLWFGYRIFFFVSRAASSAKIELPAGFKFQAERIGPGIFFSGFGVLLLGYALHSPMEFSTRMPDTGFRGNKISDANSDYGIFTKGVQAEKPGAVPEAIKAVNTLIALSAREPSIDSPLTANEYLQLKTAISKLPEFQRLYINSIYGSGTYESIKLIIKECNTNTTTCQEYRSVVENSNKLDDIIQRLSRFVAGGS